MPEPLVHVLIINWNGREHLRECFETLLESTYENARFVLVDNGSTDGSVEFVKDSYGPDPRVGVIECGQNLGWSGGNNVGIERAIAAGADYVFLLNNDTATEPDAIEKLVEMAESQPETGALAPKMLLFDAPYLLNSLGIECSIIGCGWDRGLGRIDGPKWNTPGPVIGACGGACLLRAETLRKTGLLPADYGIYLDDLELCMRIWNAGYEVWTCPGARVRHKFSATMGQGPLARRKYYLNTRNRMRLVMRNFPRSRTANWKAALVHGECKAIGRAALNGEYWKVVAHVRAWLSGAAYLFRAMAARREYRERGIARCRFWPLIRQDMLFFPGIELPADGWYPPQPVEGVDYRPISVRASLKTEGGRLRVRHMNCYPAMGETDIEVRQQGSAVARLNALDRSETIVDVASGTLEFISHRVFDADDSGGNADFGGWVAIEQV